MNRHMVLILVGGVAAVGLAVESILQVSGLVSSRLDLTVSAVLAAVMAGAYIAGRIWPSAPVPKPADPEVRRELGTFTRTTDRQAKSTIHIERLPVDCFICGSPLAGAVVCPQCGTEFHVHPNLVRTALIVLAGGTVGAFAASIAVAHLGMPEALQVAITFAAILPSAWVASRLARIFLRP